MESARVLLAWIGQKDLEAGGGNPTVGLGPIGRAIAERTYQSVILLSDYVESKAEAYLIWLRGQTPIPIRVHYRKLSTPTHFGEIYEAAVSVIQSVRAEFGVAVPLTFHLSPGTPVMAAVWIIIGKTRFPAELIQSDPKFGVQTASVPFDLSAEYLPDLLRGPDEKLERLTAELPPLTAEFEAIIHQSVVMKRLVARARRVAIRSVPVLIEGESGTGKELLARAIHQASPRRARRLVPVNCGSISPELVEAELFGSLKGSYTGAQTDRKGFFHEADGSSLFLDEIGELPLSAQVKLLRALQEGEITPVGANQPIKVNVRIIAATNRNLLVEAREGRFRVDLFYRLAVAILNLPPLREREGDVSLLIDRLLEQINHESEEEPGYRPRHISPAAKNLLLRQSWPGNVRELQNTLRRAAIWSTGSTLSLEDIQENLLPSLSETPADILNRPLGNGFQLQEVIWEVTRHYLARAAAEAQGNKTKMAKLVGLSSYQTLNSWMKRYGLDED
ncbi:MAG: sigma-54 dependent transcriptional regulator [Blastocatellia bacterium]|nr:sigma-54 dependent transcriptional regulator [Blastocatellia bacterium]